MAAARGSATSTDSESLMRTERSKTPKISICTSRRLRCPILASRVKVCCALLFFNNATSS